MIAWIWSFDKTFRTQASMIENNHGVRVAPGSRIPLVSGRADYRVGRNLLGLDTNVEISLKGRVTRWPPGGGGRSGGGTAPSAPPAAGDPQGQGRAAAGFSASSSAAHETGRKIRGQRVKLKVSLPRGRIGRVGRRIGTGLGGVALGVLGAYIGWGRSGFSLKVPGGIARR